MRIVLIAILLSLNLLAEFRAASVKVDITPRTSQWLLGYGPRKSTITYDPIFHRVVVIDNGKTQFYLVSTDLCMFSPSFYDEVAAELKQQMGIEPKQFWWSVTHTHSAPEVGPRGIYSALLKGRTDHDWDRDYAKQIKTALISAIREARGKLEPAVLRTGTGMSMANINRRARDIDGKVSLGMNPAGPVDRQLGLIRLDRPDGSPIALVANYAIHGTVLGGRSAVISGDAPGVAVSYVEQKLGTTVLFINGAAGDLAPIYSVYDSPQAGHLSQFRALLGESILQANSRIPAGTTDAAIQLDEVFVESPLRKELTWPEELAKYSRVDQSGTRLVRLPVRFLRLGDTMVWAAPVELFSEIAVGVRNRSHFPRTFYFGYTNGWFGYLPTAAAFDEGGYEPATSVFTNAVEGDLTKQVITFIEGIRP